MPLDHRPSYPQSLCYVVKLHRDADPANGRLHGVLEHVCSGESLPFGSAAELPARLLEHAAARPPSSAARGGREWPDA